jgi:hypothetical protein
MRRLKTTVDRIVLLSHVTSFTRTLQLSSIDRPAPPVRVGVLIAGDESYPVASWVLRAQFQEADRGTHASTHQASSTSSVCVVGEQRGDSAPWIHRRPVRAAASLGTTLHPHGADYCFETRRARIGVVPNDVIIARPRVSDAVLSVDLGLPTIRPVRRCGASPRRGSHVQASGICT